jgi:outer membrane protein
MKRFVLVNMLCTVILFSLSAQASITRFAVVDMNRVTAAYAEQSAEGKAFIEKRDRIQAEIDRQNKELQELNAKLAEARENGNQNQIKNLENQVRSKTQAIQTYIKTNFAELERERELLFSNENFMNLVTSIIRAIAQSEGYSMVLNKSEGSVVLWYSPAVDITNKVIERLRSARR